MHRYINMYMYIYTYMYSIHNTPDVFYLYTKDFKNK